MLHSRLHYRSLRDSSPAWSPALDWKECSVHHSMLAGFTTGTCLAVEEVAVSKTDLQQLQRPDLLVTVVVVLCQQLLGQHAPAGRGKYASEAFLMSKHVLH